ncbi:EamA family transporter [Peribacillus loiseleuriae]|uniref:EamA family transporter n=1 Tax=Peribacillus loiseleuriae TaxID=1679170 RepID=UPI003D016ECD
MVYLLVAINIIFLVSGQFLWKHAVSGVTNWSASVFIQVIFSPFFIGGAVLYVIATGLWLVIISKLPLHVAYPIQALCYVLAAVVSYLVFKENISTNQWIGILIIIFGVYFIAK